MVRPKCYTGLTLIYNIRQPKLEDRIKLQIESVMREENLTEEEARKHILDSYARLEQLLNG